MSKSTATAAPKTLESDSFSSATVIASLLLLAERFPHRQFNSAELSILSGIGRTAMSQIKNAADTPCKRRPESAVGAGRKVRHLLGS